MRRGVMPGCEVAGREELEDADEIVGRVFDRRAGQGPTAACAECERTISAGGAVGVLDPLGFVEHDEVEVQARSSTTVRDRASSSS